MKSITILFLFLTFTVNVLPQSYIWNIPLIPHGYPMNLLNGYGSSSLLNDVSNIGSINPAALENFDKISFGVSYQVEAKPEKSWIAGINSERIYSFMPQSAGLVFPLENFRFGLSLYQKYNRALLIGPIALTTVDEPDGTGEFYVPEIETRVNNYSLTASYTSEDLFPDANVSFGLRFGLNELHIYEHLDMVSLDEDLYTTDLALGVVYSTAKGEKTYQKYGLYFETTFKFNKIAEYTFTGETTYPDPAQNPGHQYYRIESDRVKLAGKMPSILRFDFETSASDKIKWLGSISGVFWSGVSNNAKDQIEASGNFVYSFNDNITTSFGIFYTDYSFKDDYYGGRNDLSALFMTAGTVIKYDNFNIHFILADSHLLSGELRKQTILKSIVSYEF